MARFSDITRCAALVSLVLGATSLTSSCTNDAEIGDLYGKWQLQNIEATRTTPDGDKLHFTSVWQYNDFMSYLNFQDRICQIQVANDERHELASVWAAFSYTADSLILRVVTSDFVEETTGFIDDDKRQIIEKYLGMSCPCDVYYEEDEDEYYYDYHDELHFGYQLTSDLLILTNDSTRWQFRHYGF